MNPPIKPGFRSWDRQRREAQPFRAKSMGFCLGVHIALRCFEGRVKPQSNDVRERKMTLKFYSLTPSLLQDCTSLPAFFGLTAESGLKTESLLPFPSSATHGRRFISADLWRKTIAPRCRLPVCQYRQTAPHSGSHRGHDQAMLGKLLSQETWHDRPSSNVGKCLGRSVTTVCNRVPNPQQL
jgi:hypothetical protein